jgi:PAS domain S-box-containing protein
LTSFKYYFNLLASGGLFISNNSNRNDDTLIDLGLNGSQARIYLALLQRGISSIREASLASGLSRPEAYRSIISLESLGLVERIITSPTKYKTLELDEALEILLGRKKKEIQELNKKAAAFYDNCKRLTVPNTEDMVDTDFVLIPQGEPFVNKVKKITDGANQSVYAMLSKKRLLPWLLNYDTIEKALARGLKVQILTEASAKMPQDTIKTLRKYDFEIRYTPLPISVSFRLFDGKEALLATDANSDFSRSPAVWSNNKCMIELMQSYFETAWYSSIQPSQDEFKRDRKQFEYLFSNMRSGFSYNRIIFDPSGVPVDFLVLDANTAFLQNLNLTKESLGKKATELFPSIGRDPIFINALKQLTDNNQAKIEYFLDFNSKWYSLLAYSPDPGHFALLAEDITEQKKAEFSLRESEEKSRIIANGSPLIWIANTKGETIFVNQTYKTFFGLTEEHAKGGKWKPLIHPDDAKTYIDQYFQALQEKKAFVAQARVRHADGEWRLIDSHGEPYFSPKKEFLGHIGVTVDITNAKKVKTNNR